MQGKSASKNEIKEKKKKDRQDSQKETEEGAHFNSKVLVGVVLITLFSSFLFQFALISWQRASSSDSISKEPLKSAQTVKSQESSQEGPTQKPKQKKEQSQKAEDSKPEIKQKAPVQETKPEADVSEDQEKLKYKHRAITSDGDYEIRELLDEAERVLSNQPSDGLKRFSNILSDHPESPRAQYGVAKALDDMSEEQRSNKILAQSIDAYTKLFDFEDVPPELLKRASLRCADRHYFIGNTDKSISVISKLAGRFPDDISLFNKLGLYHLMADNSVGAQYQFEKVLKKIPNDGFAKTHLGFILKEKDLDRAIKMLSEGITSGDPGTDDARFYYALGDSYAKKGQRDKAYEVFEEGESKGHFRSKYQRSLYNVNRLKSHPWWTLEQTGVKEKFEELAKHWKEIQEEAIELLDPTRGFFKSENEGLREKGDWKQFMMYQQGRKDAANCQRAPKTCAFFENFPEATSCKRGQIKFSVMQPGVHVWPHCGPTNCRIRAHLGLIIPEGPRIRVVEETRTWKEGEYLVFDDSFEHEVWHEGNSTRLVLIVDIWHPDLSDNERRNLSPI